MLASRPPLNCQKCQWRFFTDQGLERHLLGSHGLVTSNMQDMVNSNQDSGRCTICGRVFNNKLVAHMNTVSFVCFASNSKLKMFTINLGSQNQPQTCSSVLQVHCVFGHFQSLSSFREPCLHGSQWFGKTRQQSRGWWHSQASGYRCQCHQWKLAWYNGNGDDEFQVDSFSHLNMDNVKTKTR